MANNRISSKLVNTTAKIANLADFLLDEEGENEWEIDEIHLTPKSAAAENKVVCKYVKKDGKWVLVCKRADQW